MKKIYTYICVLSLLLLASCSDSFLDSEPKTGGTENNFYKTKKDAEKALIGCYDGLQKVWNDGVAFPVLSEIASDNCFGGTGVADRYYHQAIDEFTPTTATTEKDILNANWVLYYDAINRCNKLLMHIENIDWEGDSDKRSAVEGETRFIRAFLYFDMLRIWENIPLLTEPTEDNLPQADPHEVYGLVASDLKFAADNLPNTTFNKDEDGHATRWAAKALLARVYLFYTGYYGKTELGDITKSYVLEGLEDVISNSGHDILSNFASLWPVASSYQKTVDGTTEYAGKGNNETVFAIKYNYTSNYDGNTDGNHWLVMMGLRGVMHYPYSQGWGACTVSEDLWKAYSPNDTRRKASIIDVEGESVEQDITDQREYTGYSNKKYAPRAIYNSDGKLVDEAENLGAVNFMIGQFQDYVSIRFADVLLMAAELGSVNAQNYFDKVRQRAYGDKFVSKAVSKENILEERRLEFAFEGIRYWDVLRQGVSYAANVLAQSTTVKNGGIVTKKTIDGSNFTKTKGFQQIPNTQISLSKNVLKQNSGW